VRLLLVGSANANAGDWHYRCTHRVSKERPLAVSGRQFKRSGLEAMDHGNAQDTVGPLYVRS
jgi:hypothetical protein